MRHRASLAILLAGLLSGALLPAAAPAASARAGTDSAVAVRLAPPVVTVAEPSGLVARVSPVRSGRPVTLERYDGTGWVPLTTTTTDGRGRVFFPLATDTVGHQSLRAVAGPLDGQPETTSSSRTLQVVAHTNCSPATQPVDGQATGEATCLATRLDRWRAARLMGVGQQLNVSNQHYLDPLDELGERVAVVGFDLEELARGETYQFPDPPLRALLRLARDGAVLTASWHADNPVTGGSSTDRGWHHLSDLLDDSTPAARVFWADFDAKLELLRRFQDGDGGLYPRTAVVFRPLHEANGGFFWWGKPDPRVYRRLWARMQARAAEADVHNILWAYSFNRDTAGVRDPATLVPASVDLGGLDSYDPERGRTHRKDRLDLTGYAAVERRVPRTALTEVGPHGSRNGDWNPAVITRTVRHAGIRPAWTMLWFDDGSGRDGVSGRKQIGSLTGGPAWLRSCPNGLCSLR